MAARLGIIGREGRCAGSDDELGELEPSGDCGDQVWQPRKGCYTQKRRLSPQQLLRESKHPRLLFSAEWIGFFPHFSPAV